MCKMERVKHRIILKSIRRTLATSTRTKNVGHVSIEKRRGIVSVNAAMQDFEESKEGGKQCHEANVVEEIIAMVSEMQVGMITKVNMEKGIANSSDWWFDSSATIHVCNDKG